MAILNRERWATALLGISLLLLGAGCVLLERWTEPTGLRFSHGVHVIDQELACEMCHEDIGVADAPGMPSPDTCAICHSELDAEKEPGDRVDSLFQDGVFLTSRTVPLQDEVHFSHLRHVEGAGACDACHASILEEGGADFDHPVVGMEGCMACHEERNQPNACATCHVEIDETWAPDTHHHQWTRLHGGRARAELDGMSDNCALCHRESSCVACHDEQQPANHTLQFRERGHGFFARMDRDNCAVCHQPASCVRCHEETTPRSHRGMWGSPKNTHCIGCHFPVQEEGCFTCHVATPSHALAKPKPAWHTPSMNCRQCHGLSQPLPHLDKGDDCNLCHH